jgi:hypothetical protein
MGPFVDNPVDFAADCVCHGGRCVVARENFLFLDDGEEVTAIDWLQNKCGHVVVIPDRTSNAHARLYHTSCQRMADVVERIFAGCLSDPVSLPQPSSEMTVGEMHRRNVALPYADCVARVSRFSFEQAA